MSRAVRRLVHRLGGKVTWEGGPGAMRIDRSSWSTLVSGLTTCAERHHRRRTSWTPCSGVTVRKTIDTVIATRCMLDGFELLHSDRDFDRFEKHLGLRCVACDT